MIKDSWKEGETMTENSWKEFLSQMKVVKKIDTIRRKGTLLEEIFWWLKKRGTFVERNGWYPEGNCCGYHEQFLTGRIDRINIRIVWTAAEVGLPTLSVAVDSEKEWTMLRQSLRDAGFVR